MKKNARKKRRFFMDRKTLYQKAEKAMNQAFEATKKSAKILSQKAGEAAHITKLLIDKVTLEQRVSKQFARLGSRVYEKTAHAGEKISTTDPEIRELIEQTKKLDSELAQVEATLEQERKSKKSGKK
jgi:signal transduction histidine kinase